LEPAEWKEAFMEMMHPDIDEIRLDRVLYALSDGVRLAIVRQLAREGAASCAALDGGRPKSSMSHHFRVLRECGVVRTRSEGVTHMNELRDGDLDRRFPGLLSAILAAREAAQALPAQPGNG
jgi:DNA-binding transcriptional ArsR family regulator